MTAKQKTLLNKGMYISLGLVIGITVFAFTFGSSWAGLEGRVDANSQDITNINSKLDKIDKKIEAVSEKATETNNNVIRINTLLEQQQER